MRRVHGDGTLDVFAAPYLHREETFRPEPRVAILTGRTEWPNPLENY